MKGDLSQMEGQPHLEDPNFGGLISAIAGKTKLSKQIVFNAEDDEKLDDEYNVTDSTDPKEVRNSKYYKNAMYIRNTENRIAHPEGKTVTGFLFLKIGRFAPKLKKLGYCRARYLYLEQTQSRTFKRVNRLHTLVRLYLAQNQM